MVKLDDRIQKIKEEYVDYGNYFVINRGRQYGKTTTLHALEKYLMEDYLVFSLDFQEIETGNFANGVTFSQAFAKKLLTALNYIEADSKEQLQKILTNFRKDHSDGGLDDLFECINRICAGSPRPIVLMIDEVDNASNNQVFIDFLAQLRAYYLKRDRTPFFHSVILASVYNIKNLKLKLRPESGHQYNSPWNIATDFRIHMGFSADQIAGMLEEYETDHRTGMDIQIVAEEIYDYTSGYPVLVSAIAIVRVSKRDKSYFIHDGQLDMNTGMSKFVETFDEIYGQNTVEFIEDNGRKFFLLYLRPIINGVGNYYIEAQTRDARRTDVIVDFHGEQFIIEMKIWRGNEYNERGEKQLAEYLDYYNKDKEYLLSFNFNQKKKVGVKEIKIDGKTIVEAVV